MPSLAGYAPSTNMTAAGTAPHSPKEIPTRLELIDKLLHELREEALGLSGTFSPVLAPSPPQGNSDTQSKPAYVTNLGEQLDSFAMRIQEATNALREIRSRCEL